MNICPDYVERIIESYEAENRKLKEERLKQLKDSSGSEDGMNSDERRNAPFLLAEGKELKQNYFLFYLIVSLCILLLSK